MAYTGSVPDTGARRLDWMESMACRTEDPEKFFDQAREHEARLICIVRCPVRQQCLADVKDAERGLHRDDRDGVRAGLTGNDRYRLDAGASRRKEDAPPLVLDGTEGCGTYNAMLGHLWRGELVDPECWSAEVRRDRLNRVGKALQGRDPLPEAS